MLEITSDGRYFKTSGAAGAQLWDLENMSPIGDPFPHDSGWSATLASDANRLGTVIDDELVIWNIDLGTWPDLACLAAGRNLTQVEWEEFGPSGRYRPTCGRWPAASR